MALPGRTAAAWTVGAATADAAPLATSAAVAFCLVDRPSSTHTHNETTSSFQHSMGSFQASAVFYRQPATTAAPAAATRQSSTASGAAVDRSVVAQGTTARVQQLRTSAAQHYGVCTDPFHIQAGNHHQQQQGKTARAAAAFQLPL